MVSDAGTEVAQEEMQFTPADTGACVVAFCGVMQAEGFLLMEEEGIDEGVLWGEVTEGGDGPVVEVCDVSDHGSAWVLWEEGDGGTREKGIHALPDGEVVVEFTSLDVPCGLELLEAGLLALLRGDVVGEGDGVIGDGAGVGAVCFGGMDACFLQAGARDDFSCMGTHEFKFSAMRRGGIRRGLGSGPEVWGNSGWRASTWGPCVRRGGVLGSWRR